MMEDSGFDSGDRVANFMQNNNFGNESSTSNEEIHYVKHPAMMSSSIDDVAFRNPSSASPQVLVDHNNKSHSHQLNEHNKKLSNISQCKSLHRKLEQKVERAKKNFLHNEKLNQLENDADSKKSLTNLISIERLPFPRNSNNIENRPLVEYKSDNSDDEEVATFFPVHKKMKKSRVGRRQQLQQQQQRQQLKDVDTFSIQEMTIIESESDGNDGDNSSDDDCDSQLNLELPQRAGEWSLMDKVREMFCCLQTRQRVF